MKKALKFSGITIVILVLVVVGFAIFINAKGIPSYAVEEVHFKVESSPESIARGKTLATMLCAGCHLSNDTRKLSGKFMADVPKEFGTIYSPNITQHKESRIAEYTDGELVYLLRTGIKRNGQYAPPYMAKLPNMADEDVNAIISFLRSSDPLVAADPAPSKQIEESFLTKALCYLVFKPFPLPEHTISMPDTNNAVELGRYLVHNLDCYTCHSADFKTNNYLDPPLSEGYLGWGNQTLNLDGEVVVTQNLTAHGTGIGNWTKEQFIRVVRSGQKEGEEVLRYPMMPYSLLSEYEAGAIYEYLMTVPPIDNSVTRSVLN